MTPRTTARTTALCSCRLTCTIGLVAVALACLAACDDAPAHRGDQGPGDASPGELGGQRDALADGPTAARDGQGDAVPADAQSPDASSNPTSGSMFMGTNFWDIRWGNGSKDYFASGVDFATVKNPWRSDFLAELAPYKVLRFMDWMLTNNSTETSWSQRTKQTDAKQAPVAYEWMIDLCNRTGADMWVTLGHQTDASYHKGLAALIKQRLNPQLKVYVEFSNETWNGSFKQNDYCINKGVALKLPGMNKWYQGWAYHVYAAVRIFEQFEQVFGKSSPRVVKILSGQAANSAICKHHLVVLKDATVNPKQVGFDLYAIAPYFGGGLSSIQGLKAEIAKAVTNVQNHRGSLKASGIPLIAYEGGQHVYTNAASVNSDAAMYQIYVDYLKAMSQQIQGVFAHYTHVGKWGNGGAWGAMEYTAQPLAKAHKYRAIVDWVKTYQKP